MKKFFDYFDTRYRESVLNKSPENDGPLITISRQTGCDARQVAENVVDNLNRKYGITKWKWVDKDIIYKIAAELNTDALRVENFYKGIELSNVSEMIMAFSGQLSAACITVFSSTEWGSSKTTLLLLSTLKTVGAIASQFPTPVHKSLSTLTFIIPPLCNL